MDEMLGSLFQPDVLLSDQYWETNLKKSVLDPEKRLMLAILGDALESYQKDLLARDSCFREAEEWILEKGSNWPFCFESICESLGLDASHLRGRLFRWKETHVAQSAKIRPLRRRRVNMRGVIRERDRLRVVNKR
jgi:hypothetical protein